MIQALNPSMVSPLVIQVVTSSARNVEMIPVRATIGAACLRKIFIRIAENSADKIANTINATMKPVKVMLNPETKIQQSTNAMAFAPRLRIQAIRKRGMCVTNSLKAMFLKVCIMQASNAWTSDTSGVGLSRHLLENEAATGLIYDHGAQLVSWVPSGKAPVLWLSEHAVFAPDQAIRGGVPIVFPWFGGGISGTSTPAHGFARVSEWTQTELVNTPDRSSATYVLTESNAHSAQFPYDYRVTYACELGESLELTLTVENLDAHSFTFEAALHAYLHVGDAEQIVIEGLDGTQYRDKVSGKNGVLQVGDLRLSGPTDRVYESSGEVCVVDPVLGRRLHVRKAASANTVIWNPWSTGAANLADMGDDEWRSMVCVEGANVLGNAITLEPGEQHTMGYSLYAG